MTSPPGRNRIGTTWFGKKKRATCIAVYTAGTISMSSIAGGIPT
jgi:hypothetical protein